MGTKPPLQEGDKLLARSPVSLTNTLATTANGGSPQLPMVVRHNCQWWFATTANGGSPQLPMVVRHNCQWWFATTANGGQDYIYNALTQENRENSKRTIVAVRVHSKSATHRRPGQKHRTANYHSVHQRWLLPNQVRTAVHS